MRALDFIFFDAGGGHRSAAIALKQVIEEQERPWDVRMVNLQEVLDPLDPFYKVTGLRLSALYNLMLKKGWTLGSPQLTAGMQAVLRVYRDPGVRLLRKFWSERRPDMVVSLVPNFTRVLNWSLRDALPETPLVTILTDIADYPPHFWMEPDPQYFICGSDKAVRQAREFGHPEAHVFQASGMILNPRFYRAVEVDRAAERRKLGLDPELPTALIMFGGEGSMKMAGIAERLDCSGIPLQMILICGKNEKLVARLRGMSHRVPMYVEGFTKEIPYYMKLADFFIGKPGPGSLSEALAMQLPVIVERNAWTLPQERYNAEWIAERQVGLVVEHFRHIERAVRELLQPERFAGFRAHAAAMQNRAIFEIPDMLEKILCAGSPYSSSAAPG